MPMSLYQPDVWRADNSEITPRLALPVRTRALTTVQASAGIAVVSTDGLRGFACIEATGTRWNLGKLGTTTTLESSLSVTNTAGTERGYSAASGGTVDTAERRVSVVVPPNTAQSLIAFSMSPDTTIAYEFMLACKSTTGATQSGVFKKVAIISRSGSAVPTIIGQATTYMLRSSLNFEPFFDVGANYAQVIATSNALAPSMTWVGTVKRIMQ